MPTTFYDTLRVPPNCSEAELTASYRRLAQRFHPDRNPESPETAKQNMQRLNEAYAVLRDRQRRKAYDSLLEHLKNLETSKEQQATREKAAREQAAREQAAREQAAREQAAREQAAREEAVRQYAREKADREREEVRRRELERQRHQIKKDEEIAREFNRRNKAYDMRRYEVKTSIERPVLSPLEPADFAFEALRRDLIERRRRNRIRRLILLTGCGVGGIVATIYATFDVR